MGRARHLLRALLHTERRPSRILQRLNELLLEDDPDAPFITVCLARLRVVEDHVRATVSVGGHPLPLVVSPHGSVRSVGEPGPLLGVLADVSFHDRVIDLRSKDLLLIFTDGLYERGHRDLSIDGTLADAVHHLAGSPATDAVAALVAKFVEPYAPLHDDVAILAVAKT